MISFLYPEVPGKTTAIYWDARAMGPAELPPWFLNAEAPENILLELAGPDALLTDSAQEIKHSMLLSGWFWSQAIPSTARASISIRDILPFCTALVTLLFLVCSTGAPTVCP